MNQIIEIYTDGSCNDKHGLGAWVAILLVPDKKIILKGEDRGTTHNRMELTAALKAIEFVNSNYPDTHLKIYTDSQYLSRLPGRKERLEKKQFSTRRGEPIQNRDLVRMLIVQMQDHKIEFIKVKAHQKATEGYSDKSVRLNKEADKMARKIVREASSFYPTLSVK